MTNAEVIASVAALKQFIELDPHDGSRRFALRELIKAGIIDAMPEGALDPYRPCPGDWTALQIAYFDNGQPQPPSKKRYKVDSKGKRQEVVRRTATRFGGNIKVWTRDQINFKDGKLISWQANFYCWDAIEAPKIADDLLDERYIDQATVDLMKGVIAQCSYPSARFSIPVLKLPAHGTRWMREHVVMTDLNSKGAPERAVLVFPEVRLMTSLPFASTLPSGDGLAEPVISQARIGRRSPFGSWATEITA